MFTKNCICIQSSVVLFTFSKGKISSHTFNILYVSSISSYVLNIFEKYFFEMAVCLLPTFSAVETRQIDLRKLTLFPKKQMSLKIKVCQFFRLIVVNIYFRRIKNICLIRKHFFDLIDSILYIYCKVFFYISSVPYRDETLKTCLYSKKFPSFVHLCSKRAFFLDLFCLLSLFRFI